ncbi:collagen alpha-1(I) chain-like [Bombus vosnesenskii]|uniref:Collagen alpha-1(I) chain-like n=1 Tax=Bombus vosnesenskii TaxID=207650 RepID=A0A6J3KKH2_9HYME|nr:collagen alpha-1(I) chain-like [Bombus vosnesenskii]
MGERLAGADEEEGGPPEPFFWDSPRSTRQAEAPGHWSTLGKTGGAIPPPQEYMETRRRRQGTGSPRRTHQERGARGLSAPASRGGNADFPPATWVKQRSPRHGQGWVNVWRALMKRKAAHQSHFSGILQGVRGRQKPRGNGPPWGKPVAPSHHRRSTWKPGGGVRGRGPPEGRTRSEALGGVVPPGGPRRAGCLPSMRRRDRRPGVTGSNSEEIPGASRLRRQAGHRGVLVAPASRGGNADFPPATWVKQRSPRHGQGWVNVWRALMKRKEAHQSHFSGILQGVRGRQKPRGTGPPWGKPVAPSHHRRSTWKPGGGVRGRGPPEGRTRSEALGGVVPPGGPRRAGCLPSMRRRDRRPGVTGSNSEEIPGASRLRRQAGHRGVLVGKSPTLPD